VKVISGEYGALGLKSNEKCKVTNFSKKKNLPAFDPERTLRDFLGDDRCKLCTFLAFPNGTRFAAL
jgi:hypothetical protein